MPGLAVSLNETRFMFMLPRRFMHIHVMHIMLLPIMFTIRVYSAGIALMFDHVWREETSDWTPSSGFPATHHSMKRGALKYIPCLVSVYYPNSKISSTRNNYTQAGMASQRRTGLMMNREELLREITGLYC